MRRTRLRDHSINRLIPNMLTLIALFAGLTSIKFALDANTLLADPTMAEEAGRKWELACVAIIAAALFDALDGRIARLLDSTSKFGAELDSLSDFIAFGVAPSVILYVWTMDQAGRIGWRDFLREYRRELFMDGRIDARSRSIKNHGQKFTLRLIQQLGRRQAVTLMCHCAEHETKCHRHELRRLIQSGV